MSLYETGTIIGTVVLGLLSDKNEGARRSPTAITAIFVALLISISFVLFYNSYPETLWLISMFFYGFFLGSIHHMICVTITADLGRSHSKLLQQSPVLLMVSVLLATELDKFSSAV